MVGTTGTLSLADKIKRVDEVILEVSDNLHFKPFLLDSIIGNIIFRGQYKVLDSNPYTIPSATIQQGYSRGSRPIIDKLHEIINSYIYFTAIMYIF